MFSPTCYYNNLHISSFIHSLDAEELKLILKKYSDTFTDEDVIELGNLFYVGKGGDSVSHERHVTSNSNT